MENISYVGNGSMPYAIKAVSNVVDVTKLLQEDKDKYLYVDDSYLRSMNPINCDINRVIESILNKKITIVNASLSLPEFDYTDFIMQYVDHKNRIVFLEGKLNRLYYIIQNDLKAYYNFNANDVKIYLYDCKSEVTNGSSELSGYKKYEPTLELNYVRDNLSSIWVKPKSDLSDFSNTYHFSIRMYDEFILLDTIALIPLLMILSNEITIMKEEAFIKHSSNNAFENSTKALTLISTDFKKRD